MDLDLGDTGTTHQVRYDGGDIGAHQVCYDGASVHDYLTVTQ